MDVTDVTSSISTNTAKKLAAFVEMGLQLAQVHQVEKARVHLLLVAMSAPVLDVLLIRRRFAPILARMADVMDSIVPYLLNTAKRLVTHVNKLQPMAK